MPNSALVMGGTGFISSAIARELAFQGFKVDIFTRGITPLKISGSFAHLKGDRNNSQDLRKNISGKNYEYVFDINAYTQEQAASLLSALGKESLKRYIFCSTQAVYKKSNICKTEHFPRGDNPDWNGYGFDKKNAEDALFQLGKEEGISITILRPTYIYGPGNNIFREAYLFDRLTRNQPIPIPDSPQTKVQFVYVDDVAKTFASAAKLQSKGTQAYNLANPQPVTWQFLVRTAAQAMGITNPKIIPIGKTTCARLGITARDFFPFRDSTFLADTTKLCKSRLAMPKTGLLEGLTQSFQWYKQAKPNLPYGQMTKIGEVLGENQMAVITGHGAKIRIEK